ncbi:AVAST type 3 anti-phage nuclease/ATPase Avs3a [Vreelandella populi]|uniref:AVAST type 3 anti-phage nuclease/ATPase Avs3a n=1 Tax=Vreelandella populi TaxID=2498858 RepID=UPI000F8DC36F|nr:AVAST type 3 anti-phage nuclease/ATPase Avs3a [Halomonas populi]RUR55185.1 NACHT domain-containing protein [Halomonas populi]
MANNNLVRASRDGDQFHYLWAARRCLSLLDPRSSLVAIAIEGASRLEASDGNHLEAGEELIDVAEYYGSENISQADRVIYIQLKHSTYRASNAWTPSGIEKTLRGFSDRYRELLKDYGKARIQSKVTFCFTSNRPIQAQLLEAIADAANDRTPRHVKLFAKLKAFTGFDDQGISEFCSLLSLEGNEDGYWDQRNILFHDVNGYLSDIDVDAPVQLKELVTKKALSESAEKPTIRRLDVLRALKVDEHDLFPSPCLIQRESDAVPREQEPEITSAIIGAAQRPIIVHAAGGVGKSILATRVELGLPEGSVCVLYDCFGNGLYRNASEFRHRHKDAIPQIANELASLGLCHPLIPTPTSDPSAYLRAFLHRLQQSVTTLTAKHPHALLCIVVDAADNAQMAAEEIGERKSFVRDLLREKLPEGIRLVALCRSHRQDMLDPPPNAHSFELRPFSRAETAVFLRCSYSDATEHNVDEFHRLSSQNPRVQALAMSWGNPLDDVLRKLGPNPTTVEDTIGALLDQAIATLRDSAGSIESTQIDRICTGLAALRPLIPISVLASMSDVDETAIRSFAFDLGRPLIVTAGTIQFFDEPAETWFRERFKPKLSDLASFIDILKPIASGSAYVASVLPQIMLEAKQYSELVALALSSDSLPENNPIERRDVEMQRLQFALKASLRSKHYLDATKLAMKAAGETAGDDRQRVLIQGNTDLAAVFLESGGIQEVVSRRTFGSGWIGAHHAYEAGVMSGNADLAGDALSRLRMAYQWLQNWGLLSDEERESEQVSVEDIAEIAMAELNIYGASSATQSIRDWRPRNISFQAGSILAKRLVDHGRYQDLKDLSLAAGNNLYLLLAITKEMRVVHRYPPKEVIERAIQLVLNRREKLKGLSSWGYSETVLHAVVSLVEAALASGLYETVNLIPVLDKHLPEEPRRGLESRHGNGRFVLVRAYTLRAALASQPIELADLAYEELKEQLQKDQGHQYSQEVREFKENIGSLLPWHRLWAEVAIGRISGEALLSEIERTRGEASKAHERWYSDKSHISNEIAHLLLDILVTAGGTDAEVISTLDQWTRSLKKPLFTTTLTHITRLAARTAGLEDKALDYASSAFQLVKDEREHADTKVDAYLELSRAVLTISRAEAEFYFNAAVEVAGKIGDEVIDRWNATLDLAERAVNPPVRYPELAYQLARSGELIYDYMARDKYFDWEVTVKAIAGLCPSSAVAILSRWRDRDFGRSALILPIVILSLIERGDLHPKVALGLLPYRVDWDLPVFLEAALGACSGIAEKKGIIDVFERYATMEERSSKVWQSIKHVCKSHRLVFSEIDEFIRIAECRERPSALTNSNQPPVSPRAKVDGNYRDWDSIFSGADLTKSIDVAHCYDLFRRYGPQYSSDKFFYEVCSRAPVGREAGVIEAICGVTSFDLYQYRIFLEQLPESWKSRVSTKPALKRFVRTVFSRFCMENTQSRYYQRSPIYLACEASGLTEPELIETVLTAIGESTQIIGTNRLFSLAGLLAVKLSNSEAREALSFTLGLLEDSLEESDGDGPWSEVLIPPGNIEESIAGYIWATLAAPQASCRWEAAHSVRSMCALEQAGVVKQLMRMFANDSRGPFVDARLHFYDLHAKQWFLIALARASIESPELILPYHEHLSQIALGGTQHILIREFAARALKALIDSGHFVAPDEETEHLSTVNRSLLPVIQSKSHERVHLHSTDSTDDTDDDRFYFGIDMGPYWFEPLGRCFGISQGEVERRARDVIRLEWGFLETSRWDEDQRARKGVFKDRDTHHSHGSYPRTDNLHFYLSYHAMMTVAGHLLTTLPLHQDPEETWDDFTEWLSCHDLSRKDGRWLADRRDPAPFEWAKWKNEVSTEEWRWSLSSDDFDKVLFGSGDKINVWGNWSLISGQRRESVHITSALVSTSHSYALLRALQTTTHSHDYRIPKAGDDGEINQGGFQLKGWVVHDIDDSGVDRQDPWAGDIRFPAIQPARFVRELMGLKSDVERRSWVTGTGNSIETVFWSRTWGYFQDDDEERESGQRLETSISFIRQLLNASETDLIVSVEVSRRRRYSQHSHRENEEGLSYVAPYAKLFLIRGDGSVHTI